MSVDAYLLNITDSSFLLLASEFVGEVGRGLGATVPTTGSAGCVERLLAGAVPLGD